ncbi:MAG: bis(5'-nucleosyl)-tetraphosphatase (symmetrical) YqeK [Oscillospiraceae bacterium]|nr:bis(5'-nucleosyl)-tetraphosphatase (symmetrical) YqeK [Oscillospiraceae bacterium]
MNYEKIVREKLRDKRYNHSVNVADMCVQLAKKHGCDCEKAYIAGMLHDVMKELPMEEMCGIVESSGLQPDSIELVTPALWHGIAAAVYVRDELHIKDSDIINSIRFHTVGRGGMSILEKIVYLGDLVSVDRVFYDVEIYREYSFSDLDYAMYMALKWGICETLRKDGQIPVFTLQAYNYFNNKYKGEKI